MPVYAAAGGPRSRAIAGAHADGLLGGYETDREAIMAQVAQGARDAGRELDPAGFHQAVLVTVPVILRPGEDLTSERVVRIALDGIRARG